MNLNDELYHYGVKGMKWGVRRTPAQLGHKVKKRIKTIQKNSAKRKAEAEAKRRQSYLDSPSKLFKHRKMFTQAEIDTALKKFEWEKRLYEYSAKERKRGKEFANDALDYVDTAVRAYNTGARIYNAYMTQKGHSDRLTLVSGGEKKDEKKSGQKQQKEKSFVDRLAEYSSKIVEDSARENLKRLEKERKQAQKGSGK